MIRHTDPDFYKKIRCLDIGAYDKEIDHDVLQEAENLETTKSQTKYSVKCLTIEEMKALKFLKLVEYYKKNKKWCPTEYVEDGINLGMFWLSIRNGHTSITEV
jgi:hypothetical protein